MWIESELVLRGIALAVQVFGVLGVVVFRATIVRGGMSQLAAWFAIACTCLVGLVSVWTIESCGQGWLTFATTLPLMAVGLTLDLRKTGPSGAF